MFLWIVWWLDSGSWRELGGGGLILGVGESWVVVALILGVGESWVVYTLRTDIILRMLLVYLEG